MNRRTTPAQMRYLTRIERYQPQWHSWSGSTITTTAAPSIALLTNCSNGAMAAIDRPSPEHPKRPVDGFECKRSEVSGARVWDAIAAHWKKPEAFFRAHFIANFCPLVFMEESGRNRTPDKLPAEEREPLYRACDDHLRRVVDILDPEWLVGIGAFAEKRALETIGTQRCKIGRVLHPSPASPLANRDWAGAASRDLQKLGLCGPGSKIRSS